MFRENRERPRFDFPGISVIAPRQINAGKNLVAVDHGIDPRTVYDNDYFHVIRVIANIAIYDQEDTQCEEPIGEFDPPIEIRVAYDLFDLVKCACRLDDLKLAYWNGTKWHRLNSAEHEYEIYPPNIGQFAEAKIWNWNGDPPIAWGR